MRLPDFIIGGAPRSGTTWLYHLLARHPDAHMAAPVRPEPKFFLVDDIYARGLQYYSATWFASARAGTRCGEKSTNYLESSEAAARIHRDLPLVRLVFVLREPSARAWSNYVWSRMNGMESESFERALELEEDREAALSYERRFSRPHAYFSRGLYAAQLKPWLALFSPDRILCLRFETIVSEPQSIAAMLHRFLELPIREQDAQGLGPINASEPDAGGFSPRTASSLRARYARPNQELYELLGPGFGTWS